MKKQAMRAGARAGFTLTEAIVVIVILGVLAAVIAPRIIGRVGQSKQSVAAANAASLANAMHSFALDNGMPEAGASITVLWERPGNIEESAWKGPYVNSADELKDPWGNLYVLRIPGEVNADFDIVSYGRDGQPGGQGEDADIVNGKR